MNNAPAKVYKYAPQERARKVLEGLLIRFSQASVMNDIEEFRPPIKGLASDTTFKQKFRERANALFPGLMKLVDQQGPAYMAKQHNEGEQRLQQTVKTIYDTTNENFGILSLSEESTSAKMWDKYTDEGRGFLLEFDPTHRWFWQKAASNDDFRHLRRITYVADRAQTYLLDLDGHDYLYTKEMKWAYEKEWRLILNFNSAACKAGKDAKGTDVLLFAIPPDCVLSVTVGYNASPEFIEQVRAAIAANPSLSHLCLRAAKLGANGSVEIGELPQPSQDICCPSPKGAGVK
jgi:DUF2971 family protein